MKIKQRISLFLASALLAAPLLAHAHFDHEGKDGSLSKDTVDKLDLNADQKKS